MQNLINTNVAHYTIVSHIAKGGMSDIYLARDTHTEQEIALKLVAMNHREYCQRFQREAAAIASLDHEHILPALDHGEFGPWCYLAMPYVAHGTLRDRIQEGPLTLEETGKYLHQVASALHHAHQHDIIHRDIKPSNILMRDRDFIYLADFGLVKHTRNVAESLTETGFLVGTAAYMAPELAEEDATHLSDIYSLGIILYQMLTGDVPFKGSTPVGTFMQHLSRQPLRPSLVNPNLPGELDDVILFALAKDPARRYQSALELAGAYQQALDEHAQRYANSVVTTKRVSVSLPKRPRIVAAAAVALVAAASLTLGSSAHMLYGTDIAADNVAANSIVQTQHTNQSDGNPSMLERAAYIGNSLGKPFIPASPARPANIPPVNTTTIPIVDTSNSHTTHSSPAHGKEHPKKTAHDKGHDNGKGHEKHDGEKPDKGNDHGNHP